MREAGEVEPFAIAVDEGVLSDLRRRLDATARAPDFGNADWRYGLPSDYLAELVEYWREGFDWRAQERRMNAFSHYRTMVSGLPIHFIHVRGRGPKPVPLILTHGWPWTFWDFARVIGPLSDPIAHGGDPADAFDVVIPSLPGYGFSTPLTHTGVTPEVIADLWVRLMCEHLGYARFGAHGADWGMRVVRHLGQSHADRLIGLHLSNASIAGLVSDRPWADAFAGIYQGSSSPREELVTWERGRAAHVAVHGIDPQTLAHAMHDSPAGLCAWLVERRRTWSDCGGDVESVFSRDDLLTTTTLYWVTDSFASSLRLYWEAMNGPRPTHSATTRVETPTGISLFLRDTPPGYDWDWLGEVYNLRLLREHHRGGHFSAAEQPDTLIADLRDTFRLLRG
jgi:hypothetical protein